MTKCSRLKLWPIYFFMNSTHFLYSFFRYDWNSYYLFILTISFLWYLNSNHASDLCISHWIPFRFLSNWFWLTFWKNHNWSLRFSRWTFELKFGKICLMTKYRDMEFELNYYQKKWDLSKEEIHLNLNPLDFGKILQFWFYKGINFVLVDWCWLNPTKQCCELTLYLDNKNSFPVELLGSVDKKFIIINLIFKAALNSKLKVNILSCLLICHCQNYHGSIFGYLSSFQRFM